MLDFIFGEGQYGLRFLFAFIAVLGLIGLTAWLVRRFGTDRLGAGSQRGRQPRLAVIDAAAVDGRRRLILIRRDNIEHLLMIGGPSDVVVEANIVRAAPAQREATPPRPAATETLPRAVPLGEGSMWPLQPEPAPAPPPPRPQRQPLPPVVEEPMQWHAEPEPPPPPIPTRQPRTVDPLAGLAAELSRHQPQPEPPPPRPMRESARERESIREPARMAPPAPPADPQFASPADQNLAEMAQRLEAALRRPGGKGEARPEPRMRAAPAPAPAPREAAPPPPPAPQPEPEPDPEPQPAPAPIEAKPARSETRAARAEPRPAREQKAGGTPQGKSLYDSLEQEMASLLGRPNKT